MNRWVRYIVFRNRQGCSRPTVSLRCLSAKATPTGAYA